MPEKTLRVFVSPALILSKIARKTIGLPLDLLAQPIQLLGRYRASADAAPARPVTIAAPAHRQPQARCPRSQFQGPATPHVRVFGLDGAKAEGPQLRQRS